VPRPPDRVYPGVRALLDALEARSDVLLGLLTGNIRRGCGAQARVRRHPHDFRVGAFGSDCERRDGLPPVAVERALRHERRHVQQPRHRHHRRHAQRRHVRPALGVRAIGVATGSYTADTRPPARDRSTTRHGVRAILADAGGRHGRDHELNAPNGAAFRGVLPHASLPADPMARVTRCGVGTVRPGGRVLAKKKAPQGANNMKTFYGFWLSSPWSASAPSSTRHARRQHGDGAAGPAQVGDATARCSSGRGRGRRRAESAGPDPGLQRLHVPGVRALGRRHRADAQGGVRRDGQGGSDVLRLPAPGQHRHSFVAARAARCAGDQGRFWEYHDRLFGTQQTWMYSASTPTSSSSVARTSASTSAVRACLRSDSTPSWLRRTACSARRWASAARRPSSSTGGSCGEWSHYARGARGDPRGRRRLMRRPPLIRHSRQAARRRTEPTRHARRRTAWHRRARAHRRAHLRLHERLQVRPARRDRVRHGRLRDGAELAVGGASWACLCRSSAWRATAPARRGLPACSRGFAHAGGALVLAGGATIGLLFSAYLTYLEAFVIHAWCRWCIASAVLAVLIFIFTLPEFRRLRSRVSDARVNGPPRVRRPRLVPRRGGRRCRRRARPLRAHHRCAARGPLHHRRAVRRRPRRRVPRRLSRRLPRRRVIVCSAAQRLLQRRPSRISRHSANVFTPTTVCWLFTMNVGVPLTREPKITSCRMSGATRSWRRRR
jgi:hypothetical protein